MSQTNSELAEILQHFLNEPDRQEDIIPNDHYLKKLQKQILEMGEMGSEVVARKIDELREDIKCLNILYDCRRPYLYVYLAFAYSLMGIGSDTINYAKQAYSFRWNNKWDKAIYYWFLGMVYYQNKMVKDATDELTTARQLLEEYKKFAEEQELYSRVDKCNSIIKKIKKAIDSLPPRTPNLSRTAYTGYLAEQFKDNVSSISQETASAEPSRGNTEHAPIGQFRSNQQEDNNKTALSKQQLDKSGNGGKNDSQGSNTDSPSSLCVNIHIPVEISTNDTIEFSSVQNQHNKQYLESRQTNSVEAGSNLNGSWSIPLLPEQEQPLLEENKIFPKNQEQILEDIFDIGYIITPGIPLYGGASAGPNGTVVLDQPDFLVIDEISLIRLEGKEYRIYSLRRGDNQISISAYDFLSSILGQEIREQLKLDGSTYGWLRVTGNSMNKAVPIAIENNDLVLFYEKRDIESCVDKIIILSIPNKASYVPRLVIKRLIKANGKYFLHSESDFALDPTTGDDYTIDLELTMEHQVIGIVVAVASDKPKNPPIQ